MTSDLATSEKSPIPLQDCETAASGSLLPIEEAFEQLLGIDLQPDGTYSKKRPSKGERKRAMYQKKLANYRTKKEEKKKQAKAREQAAVVSEDETDIQVKAAAQPHPYHIYPNYFNKRELRRMVSERLERVYGDESLAARSLKICIDCSFSHKMSFKEQSRLAQQVGRCYASNKARASPVHLTLCQVAVESAFYAELCRVNHGFAAYKLAITDQAVVDSASSSSSLVYLSPDASELIEDVNADETYVIGGLVDETVAKQVTWSKCRELSLRAKALPIEKHMARREQTLTATYNYNKILSINQVFDILADYFAERDWPRALEANLPKRKGFVVAKTDDDQSRV